MFFFLLARKMKAWVWERFLTWRIEVESRIPHLLLSG